MDWKKKLTSRKFWAAIASFVALLVVACGGAQEQAAQITAIIMAGATVVAYIVGEGLVDAASAGATVNISGNAALMPTGETVNTDVPATASTGADRAAEVKQVTAAGSGESGAVASGSKGAV
jgi:hypothetical protein